jgi:NitT/TauT family transport system substrate-binding protein
MIELNLAQLKSRPPRGGGQRWGWLGGLLQGLQGRWKTQALINRLGNTPIARLIAAISGLGAIATVALLLLGAIGPVWAESVKQHSAKPTTLKVQLQWAHQGQFAGFYVAQARRYFEAEGLSVELIAGGPGINPIKELQAGKADIAVAWFNNAWQLSTQHKRVTNIAQITAESSLYVVCRISLGIYTARDVEGKKIGVWNLGDEIVVKDLLSHYGIDPNKVELIQQSEGGKDLIDGTLPCVTAMAYNEYESILRSEVDDSDLIVLNPTDFMIPHIEDGLYVLTDRLKDPEFQETLAVFLRALRRGWDLSRRSPTLAVEHVNRISPELDRHGQQQMVENMLAVIPRDKETFGLFNLKTFDAVVAANKRYGQPSTPPEMIWTHDVWENLQTLDHSDRPIHVATIHYVRKVTSSTAFYILLTFGMLTFALSGVLEAINRGYDIWGRLSLAFLSGLGGGTLRDFLIGGDRLPLSYVRDLTTPTGILIIVFVATFITAFNEDLHKTKLFKSVKMYADIIGFSVLAIAGAMFSISAGLPWFWAPICAALSCAGGGVLRDIVVNQEPTTFKGVLYEELAVLGALVFVAGLMIANTFEQTPMPVYVTVVVSILVIMIARVLVYHYHVRYPKILMGTRLNP